MRATQLVNKIMTSEALGGAFKCVMSSGLSRLEFEHAHFQYKVFKGCHYEHISASAVLTLLTLANLLTLQSTPLNLNNDYINLTAILVVLEDTETSILHRDLLNRYMKFPCGQKKA